MSAELTPASLFPAFTDQLRGVLSDHFEEVEFAYYYVDDSERASMTWRRRKTWNRSFMGRKGAQQPTRQVYLRTLANLTNPAETRGVLRLMRKNYLSEAIKPDLLRLSDRILPQRYQRVSVISTEGRNLLFAEVKDNDEARYSEFHMSSGERTVLRISKDISNLEDALVLIDEIETGLHPYTQQHLMLSCSAWPLPSAVADCRGVAQPGSAGLRATGRQAVPRSKRGDVGCSDAATA